MLVRSSVFFWVGLAALSTFAFTSAAAAQSQMTTAQQDRHQEATEEANADTSGLHLDLDIGFHRTFIGFITKGDVAPEACQLLGGCESPTLELMTSRILLGFGFGGLTVEGGFELPVTDDKETDYGAALFGLRVDTSGTASFFGHFRIDAVFRFGSVSGGGARVAFGFDIRPIRYLGFYLEGGAEVLSADGVNGEGINSTVVAYGYQLGGGLRGSLPFD